jgi:hypothetical protein
MVLPAIKSTYRIECYTRTGTTHSVFVGDRVIRDYGDLAGLFAADVSIARVTITRRRGNPLYASRPIGR